MEQKSITLKTGNDSGKALTYLLFLKF